MKKLVLLLVLFSFSIILFSQNDTICGSIPYKDKKVCYENVITVNSASAVLYANSKIWITKNFGNSASVIQSDVENSLLVIKGSIKKGEYTTYKFTLTLQFKDGRYKYTLTDLYYHFMTIENPVEAMPFMSSCIEKTVIEFNGIFYSLIDSFDKGIKQDNNW